MTTPYKKKAQPSHKKQVFLINIQKIGDTFKLNVQADKYLRYWLGKNAKDGDVGSMTLELKRPKRSQAQNNFYYLYLGLISESCGEETDDLHNLFKGLFLSKGITEVYGHKVRKVGSTTNLNISEFVEYMMRIEELTGIPIPNPEPFSIGLSYDEYNEMKRKQKEYYRGLKSKKFIK